MGAEDKVPKTILEEIIEKTFQDLKSNPEFDLKVLIELQHSLKDGTVNPEDIIQIIKGEDL